MVAYADLNTIQTTDPGDILTAAWCDQARDNGEFLIDPPACSVYHNAAQSVAANTTATPTALTANSENYDNNAMHSTAVDTSKITAVTAGRLIVFGQVEYAANATGYRYMAFKVNGGTVYDGMLTTGQNGTNTIRHSASRTITMAAGDYVELVVAQNSGGALNITNSEFAALYLTR